MTEPIVIHATGKHFDKASNVKSMIEVLKGYEQSFSKCIEIACKSQEIPIAKASPQILLKEISGGSVNFHMIMDFASAIAPLAPQIFNYTWTLYKAGYDVLLTASNHLLKNKEPIVITITDSPGATVNIVNGDQIQASNDAYGAATMIYKGFNYIADLIRKETVNSVSISTKGHEPLEFTKENADAFKIPSITTIEEDTVKITCNISRFNKKTLKGFLDISDGEEVFSRPFEIKSDLFDTCLESFKSPLVFMEGHREVEVNALGEIKVLRYHITAINSPKAA